MATVNAPAAEFVATFEGDLAFTGPGAVISGPPVVFEAAFEGTLQFTTGQPVEWRAVLTDAAGTVVAQAPEASVGSIQRQLNQPESFTITVPLDSRAGAAIAAEAESPLLEWQVWRGDRCRAWGPITDPRVDLQNRTVTCRVQGAAHHLDRTRTGPAALQNLAPNPQLSTGLQGWGRLHTDLIPFGDGQIGTFLSPAGYFTHVPHGTAGHPEPPVEYAGSVLFSGGNTSEDGGLQLFHDRTVESSLHGSTIVTLRALWWMNWDEPFFETNLNLAMILSLHPPTQRLPIGYYVPSYVALARWDDEGDIPRSKWHEREVVLEIPPNSGSWTLHAALHAPRCTVWATMIELTVDPPIPLSNTGPAIVKELVEHAQDTDYGHVDRNIGFVYGVGGGPIVDETLHEGDHRPVLGMVDALVREGRVEWRSRYAPGSDPGRQIHCGRPSIGTRHRKHRVTVTDEGRTDGKISHAEVERRWSGGSTVVTAQTGGGRSKSESAATTGTVAWEEVLVAPDWVPRWRLSEWAYRTLADTANPFVVEIIGAAGSVWADGTIEEGDTVDALIDRDGVSYSGLLRVQRLTLDPATDVPSAVLVPYTPPLT